MSGRSWGPGMEGVRQGDWTIWESPNTRKPLSSVGPLDGPVLHLFGIVATFEILSKTTDSFCRKMHVCTQPFWFGLVWFLRFQESLRPEPKPRSFRLRRLHASGPDRDLRDDVGLRL